MGATDGHQPGAVADTGQRHRWRLWTAFTLLGTLMVAEAVTAVRTGSLTLLGDAGHMFTDVLGIGMSLAALTLTSQRGKNPQRTFGLYRVEVLAALTNALMLSAVSIYVLVEAIRRFSGPPEVDTGPMLVVAVLGLLANIVAFVLLRPGAKESINLKGAYLEALSDLLGSLSVIAAALIIAGTGWQLADPLIAVALGLFRLPRIWLLGRAATRILVQAAPEHLQVTAVQDRLIAVPGVTEVHDLHVWTLTSGIEVTSAHLTVDPGADIGDVLGSAQTALREEFRIEHATLQVEPDASIEDCGSFKW
ncbi:cation diffusion facilitator family transporter [Salinispora tropica]|uniref:cation diffusion facilitator family transporter n=1 Tax=Salinispora tropica TaxID=168695 RepID=UPI00048AA105|nr:cation diffusion facilitator family transporter [Salinispora tropica]